MALALVVAACGGPNFVRSGTERDPAPREEHQVGAGVDLDALDAGDDDAADDGDGDTPEADPSRDPTDAGTAGAGGGPEGPANVSEHLDERSRLHLTLVVADRLEFGPEDPIRFELQVENRSGETRYVDSNQRIVFALFPEDGDDPAWHDHCGIGVSHETQDTGAQQVDPGATILYTGQYPERDLGGGRDSNPDCRVPPGAYLVISVADWCPDEAIEWVEYRDKRDPSCRLEGVVRVSSAPIRITIHAA